MRAGSCYMFWLSWSSQILRSSQTPSLGASSRTSEYESWALPGIDSEVETGRYFDQLDRRNYQAETSFQGQGSTYFQESPSEVASDSVHPLELNSLQQRVHLDSLEDPQKIAINTPHLIRFVEEFAEVEGRIFLLQRALKWLLEVEEMPETDVATWVELLTVSYRVPSTGEFSKLQFHALLGLYSLMNKYTSESKQKIVGFIRSAIQLFEISLLSQREPFRRPTVPWVTEMLSLVDGVSSTYDGFEKIISYEPRFYSIRTAIRSRNVSAIKAQLPKLKHLALQDTPNVPAQTKTAAILYLYHLAAIPDNWIKHQGIQPEAVNILTDFTMIPRDWLEDPVVAPHDLILVLEILSIWSEEPVQLNSILRILHWIH